MLLIIGDTQSDGLVGLMHGLVSCCVLLVCSKDWRYIEVETVLGTKMSGGTRYCLIEWTR